MCWFIWWKIYTSATSYRPGYLFYLIWLWVKQDTVQKVTTDTSWGSLVILNIIFLVTHQLLETSYYCSIWCRLEYVYINIILYSWQVTLLFNIWYKYCLFVFYKICTNFLSKEFILVRWQDKSRIMMFHCFTWARTDQQVSWRPSQQRPEGFYNKACSCSDTKQIRLRRELSGTIITTRLITRQLLQVSRLLASLWNSWV